MNAEQLWADYCKESGIDIHTPYEAWQFGGAPDKLADLVRKGIKTATCSLNYWYEVLHEPCPKIGDYSVILNHNDEAVCIIQTTKVLVVPFCEVSKEHAYKEGEGDRSYAYWRDVHIEFFTEELSDTDVSFSQDMDVLCEEFKLVYCVK